MRALGCIALVCLASAPAFADGAAGAASGGAAEGKVAAGEDLAKQGRLTEAIDSFKAADKIEKRAKHACLIALAYIRRELWPQAEIFLTTCHERANATDPVPDWVPLAEQQLKERLAKAKVAAVKIRVAPDELASRAQIAVSSFEPDELFAPRTVHLTRGKHLITATVDNRTTQQTIEIADDRPREVLIDFDRKDTGPRPAPVKLTPVDGPSRIPLAILGAGAAMVLGGAAYHVVAFKPARDDLAAAEDPADYDRLEAKFDARRTTTIALYSAGALTVAIGVVLRYTVFKGNPERAPTASLSVARGGGVVALEWSR